MKSNHKLKSLAHLLVHWTSGGKGRRLINRAERALEKGARTDKLGALLNQLEALNFNSRCPKCQAKSRKLIRLIRKMMPEPAWS
jgi:predicted Zn-ribbon and HTH transcriptional regulator